MSNRSYFIERCAGSIIFNPKTPEEQAVADAFDKAAHQPNISSSDYDAVDRIFAEICRELEQRLNGPLALHPDNIRQKLAGLLECPPDEQPKGIQQSPSVFVPESHNTAAKPTMAVHMFVMTMLGMVSQVEPVSKNPADLNKEGY